MRSLFVEALGTFTAVGINVPQTMGSLRTCFARHAETSIFRSGKPLVASATPIPTDLAHGDQRLQAMGAFALRECASGRPAPLPLLLCLPAAAAAQAQGILEGIVRHAGIGVDMSLTRIFAGGQAVFATALLEADALPTPVA